MTPPPFAADLAACRAAQLSWSRQTVRERLRPIRELRRLLVDRADDIIATIHADIARPAVEVLGTELLPTAAALKFLEQQAAALLRPRPIPGRLRPTWLFRCRDTVYRRPWGVVAVIGTWNYPLFLNVGQIAQALTAGNGVVWKPSEHVPKTAELTHRLFVEAGFPPDLFRLLPATREAGPLVAEADVDHVVFTGSDGVGRRLAARLGERLVPSTLELSGCDAMFVLADADVTMAAHAAWFGITLNRGQTCIAVRRIFVHRPLVAAFIDVLRPLVARAEPMRLMTEGQRTQAERLIADAVSRGATPLGSEDSASRLTPTVLLDTPADAALCREAAFAPLAALIPFDTIDEALSLAAQSPFGLAASVFSADRWGAQQLAARIPAGAVTINDVLAPTAHPATPFGGRGSSGWGVTQGAEGLLAMTTPQTVTVHKGRFRPHVDEAVTPHPEATAQILRGLLRATHGRGLRNWLGGIWQAIRGVWRK